MPNIFKVLIVLSVISTANLLDIPFISDVQDLIGLAHDIGDIAAGNVPLKSYFVQTVNPLNVIIDTVTQLVDQVTDLGNQINGKLDSILNAILVRVPLEGKIDDDMKEITTYMAKIDRKYDDFEVYSEFPQKFAEKTLRKHIDYVVGTNAGDLQDLLHSLLLIIVPPKSTLQRSSFLENIRHLRFMSTTMEICDLDLSFQYRLYKIYNILMITELKSFIMTEFAYKQMGELDDDTYEGEMEREQAKFIMRANQYQIEIKTVMQGAPRDVYRCGPDELIEGETYIEFEKVFSIYVINQYQMGFCDHPCYRNGVVESHDASYSVMESQTFRDVYFNLWIINKCRGRLNDCQWLGTYIDICENPEGSKKRYQYVKSDYYGNYGQTTSCEGGTFSETRYYRGKHRLCDVCMCICREDEAESTALRTLSLRPQISNIEENMVVSNLRFVSKDNMIHIQIEESPLLPIGILNTNYSNWVPLEDFVYLSNVSRGAFVVKNGDEYKNLTEDVDYLFLTIERHRLNLDEVSGNESYVVTGVRFKIENDNDRSSPFQLEVHFTPVDYVTGKLVPTDDNPSVWLNWRTQPNPPNEYTKPRDRQPNGSKVRSDWAGPFTPVEVRNKFVDFDVSNRFVTGQNTVPFLDARPTVVTRNIAYDGVGLMFYLSENEHTGLVGLKVMTMNLASYVKPQMNRNQLKYYKKLYHEPLRYNPAKVQ